MLHEILTRIMQEYPTARQEQFTNHPLANYIRNDVPKLFQTYSAQHPRLIWDASAGQGQWSDAPWIAVFDPLVTTTAQDGYYPVYLFTRRLDAVYLSFNQGMTKIRREFKKAQQAKDILRNHASILRNRLTPEYADRFNTDPIDLQPPQPSSRLAFYEPGHVFGIRYDRNRIPRTEELAADLFSMIDLYFLATMRGGVTELDLGEITDGNPEADPSEMTLEERRRFRFHRTVERNARLAAEAKRIHGHTCQVCEFNFERVYGHIGHQYIEAHHLTPLSQLALNQVVQLSPKDDFRVVCANCHRMIHRRGAPTSFAEFKQQYRQQNGIVS